jgi:hypothetical protein
MKQQYYYLGMAAILLILWLLTATSCTSSRNGYGCKGNSRYITGYKNSY